MRLWLPLLLVLFIALTILPAWAADAPEIDRAKSLLAEMRGGKVTVDAYDKQIEELAGMGQPVVPLLIETLGRNDGEDHYRKLGAIKALAGINDGRIAPALKSAVALETDARHLQAELVALLTQSPGPGTADYVAEVIGSCGYSGPQDGGGAVGLAGPVREHASQELLIRAVSESSISTEDKLSLFASYDKFGTYGRQAVITGLRRIDNAEAFAQLSALVAKGESNCFEFAAEALGQLKNSDPMPVLLHALKSVTPLRIQDWILAFGERKYQPAAPVLEERVRALRDDDPNTDRIRMLAAGILCSLGRDYERNAEIVRRGLMDEGEQWSAYKVAGLLSDEQTVQVVCSRIDAVPTQAIPILGKMGSASALTALRDASTRSREHWPGIGEAIARIGRKQGDQSLVTEGEGLQSLHSLVGYEYCQGMPDRAMSEASVHTERGAAYIRQRPQIIPNLFAAESPGRYWVINAIEKGWTPEAVPFLEEVVATNTHLITYVADDEVRHYDIRELVARLLSKKTGRPYTYVDVDGAVRQADVPLR